ncbi:Gfo/Idh/MocA family protein [Paenibacillus koleovorans]|uniref:Gfo/Idh/MocA family protein n=1 Tax=Paenibacillus koleovorans TaxID=121608 RepID=UPI000FDB66D9|nr:Gfo/Idh/MocA family oxidoreductase [Paenibacillus koleovorans]
MERTTDKIRLGIIGCGGMASSHAKGYEELAGRMQVTATCDIELERAQEAATYYGAQLAVADYHELLDHVDAVLVVLPHDLHYEVGMTCLRAGKHVLMEKPMGNSEQECIDLIELSEQVGRVFMIAYPVRHHPLMVKMKELIDDKTYGDVFQMSIYTEQYTRYYDGHWALDSKRLGGGQFFSHGCHYVDILLWVLGNPVRGTHLGTNYGTPWMEREGTSNMTMEFENGALGMHLGTWGARGTRLGSSMHVHCTKGMLELVFSERRLYLHHKLDEERAGIKQGEVELLMEVEEGGKFTHHEIHHFLDCVQYGQRPLTDGPGSLQGLRCIWRMYDAERNHVMADLRGLGLEQDWRQVPLGSGSESRA